MTTKTQDGFITSAIKRQGMSFVLMLVAVFFLHKQNESVRKEILSCEKEKVELLKEQNKSLETVIAANTVAITTLKDYIKTIEKIKPNRIVSDASILNK